MKDEGLVDSKRGAWQMRIFLVGLVILGVLVTLIALKVPGQQGRLHWLFLLIAGFVPLVTIGLALSFAAVEHYPFSPEATPEQQGWWTMVFLWANAFLVLMTCLVLLGAIRSHQLAFVREDGKLRAISGPTFLLGPAYVRDKNWSFRSRYLRQDADGSFRWYSIGVEYSLDVARMRKVLEEVPSETTAIAVESAVLEALSESQEVDPRQTVQTVLESRGYRLIKIF